MRNKMVDTCNQKVTPRMSGPRFGLQSCWASRAAANAAFDGASSTDMRGDEGIIGVKGTSMLRRRDETIDRDGESKGDPGADTTGVTGKDPRWRCRPAAERVCLSSIVLTEQDRANREGERGEACNATL